MIAAWFFDALPGLLAILVAGLGYASAHYVVRRATSKSVKAPAASETDNLEGAAGGDVFVFDTGAFGADAPVVREAGALTTPYWDIGAGAGTSNLTGVRLSRGLVTDHPDNDWLAGMSFLTDRGAVIDVHGASGSSSGGEFRRRMLEAIEANRLAAQRMAEAFRAQPPPRMVTPDENEEAAEPR